MCIEYDRVELLEFFDEETIVDEEALQTKYSLNVDRGFLFELYISLYDEFAAVTLKDSQANKYIFNIGINRIVKIELDEKKQGISWLKFYREGNEDAVLRLQVKPRVFLQCDI